MLQSLKLRSDARLAPLDKIWNLTWTNMVPTEPGWYWWRDDCQLMLFESDGSIPMVGGEFLGPL